MGDDMGLRVERLSDGSVLITALWHSSVGVYTVWDGDPDDGGQTIEGLTRMASQTRIDWWANKYNYPGVTENVVPGAIGTLTGILCNP
jgi:hypothetical protein